MFLALEIACLECGMGEHVCHGVFDTVEAARKAMEGLKPNYFSNEFEVVEYRPSGAVFLEVEGA